jgi:predicted transcriptional regulator
MQKFRFDHGKFTKLVDGFSNELIAEVVGVTRFTIGRWKKGRGEPLGSQLMALMRWLVEQQRMTSVAPENFYVKQRRKRRA